MVAVGGHQQADCFVETAPLRVMLAGPRHVVNKDATGQLLPPIWWKSLNELASTTTKLMVVLRSICKKTFSSWNQNANLKLDLFPSKIDLKMTLGKIDLRPWENRSQNSPQLVPGGNPVGFGHCPDVSHFVCTPPRALSSYVLAYVPLNPLHAPLLSQPPRKQAVSQLGV